MIKLRIKPILKIEMEIKEILGKEMMRIEENIKREGIIRREMMIIESLKREGNIKREMTIIESLKREGIIKREMMMMIQRMIGLEVKSGRFSQKKYRHLLLLEVVDQRCLQILRKMLKLWIKYKIRRKCKRWNKKFKRKYKRNS